MKGRSSPQLGPGPTSKWTAVLKTIREQKIGILALQETHLSDILADQVSALHHRRIVLLNSPSTNNPTGSAGVAFVINKELIDAREVSLHTLIPGRATYLSFKWRRDITIRIINIYAPNNLRQHQQFWSDLENQWSALHLPKPDFMMGDFNLTEDAMDRAPARAENEQATQALRACQHTLDLRDSWRHRFPTERTFTFTMTSQTMSRIDRIYAQTGNENAIVNWSHDISSIPSDHKMVSLRLAPPDAPFIGKDRWSWLLGLLHNKDLNKSILNLGQELQDKINGIIDEDPSTNPQILWQEFKEGIKREAQSATKKQIPKITQKITALKKDLTETYQCESLDTSPDTRTNAAFIEKEIEYLEKKKYRRAFTRSQALWHLKGEKVNKYWTRINNPRKPRDLVYRLVDPNSQRPTTRSDEMAELARNYHDSLQTENILPPSSPQRTEAIEEALNAIPEEQKLLAPTMSPLASVITINDLEKALSSSKMGTAAGPDGIPYELWKNLHAQHRTAVKNQKPSFDVLKYLLLTLTDIQKNGVDPRTAFTLGWMCPIYKKKEKDQIKNYRPITLLNTDYKLLTKALSNQLAQHIQSLLHPDQAGFIPKRLILDPIRLNQSLCAYADYMEENGVIVALDQEKAYDKIDHHYLLKTLESFNLPPLIIKTIQSLYKTASTAVLINGVVSSPFSVQRGVRQGDPLSCLLFDLAIEPLACLLRTAPTLTGFEIPGIKEKLIVSLYADDTTIYLSETDSYADLQSVEVARAPCKIRR